MFVFLQQKKWFSFTSLALESYQLTMFTHSCCAREVFPHKGLQQQQQRRQQQQQQQHMSAQTCSDWTLMSACRALSQKRKRRRRRKSLCERGVWRCWWLIEPDEGEEDERKKTLNFVTKQLMLCGKMMSSGQWGRGVQIPVSAEPLYLTTCFWNRCPQIWKTGTKCPRNWLV